MNLIQFQRLLSWYFIYAGPTHPVTVPTANGLLSFDSKDWLVGKHLYVYRELERAEMQEAMRLLEKEGCLHGPSDTLLDVGANIGMTCIPLLKAGHFQRAIAFEPAPDTYRYLERNIRQNGLDQRICAFPWALSSRSGTCQMEISKDNSGDNRVRLESRTGFFGEEGRSTIDVPVKTIDELLMELAELRDARISLVWVDVQGHEGHFFRGAKSLFASGIPAVSEFWPYGILRSGMSETDFGDIVSELFTHFYVLSKQAPVKRDISEVSTLFRRYGEPRHFCSVLWLNTTPESRTAPHRSESASAPLAR